MRWLLSSLRDIVKRNIIKQSKQKQQHQNYHEYQQHHHQQQPQLTSSSFSSCFLLRMSRFHITRLIGRLLFVSYLMFQLSFWHKYWRDDGDNNNIVVDSIPLPAVVSSLPPPPPSSSSSNENRRKNNQRIMTMAKNISSNHHQTNDSLASLCWTDNDHNNKTTTITTPTTINNKNNNNNNNNDNNKDKNQGGDDKKNNEDDNNRYYPPADGTFNGVNIYLRNTNSTNTDTVPIHSSFHCVGHNFRPDAWIYRSCQFQQLCFDVIEKDYVLFQSPQEQNLMRVLQRSESSFHTVSSAAAISAAWMKMNHVAEDTTISQGTAPYVALGGLNPRWGTTKSQRLQWFPKIIPHELKEPYYALPSNYVMIPFHSFSASNPGHLLWDDLLPIFSLLSMFRFQNKQLLLMRYILKTKRPLWLTCDENPLYLERCNRMYTKFLPIMGIHPSTFRTTEDFQLNATSSLANASLLPSSSFYNNTNATTTATSSNNNNNNTNNNKDDRVIKYVCSRMGAAGLGALTDHGPYKLHGWDESDYEINHNHGRGPILDGFRSFVFHHLGLPLQGHLNPKGPYRITFSYKSSERHQLYFTRQRIALFKYYEHNPMVQIEAYKMSNFSAKEQIEIASKSAIYITADGGGSAMGTFLSPGSSLLIYFNAVGGYKDGQYTYRPARLDWDLWNNHPNIRVHWIPYNRNNQTNDMNRKRQLEAFIALIDHELDIISHLDLDN